MCAFFFSLFFVIMFSASANYYNLEVENAIKRQFSKTFPIPLSRKIAAKQFSKHLRQFSPFHEIIE